MPGWIGVDLDGTLAFYDEASNIDSIGAPIGPMVARVRKWLAEGQEVRIVTARVFFYGGLATAQRKMIQDWCADNLGQVLPVCCCKDFEMIELWDDRVVQVVTNTGLTPAEAQNQ